MPKLICNTVEEKLGAIAGLDTFGLFSMTYVADKTPELLQEAKRYNHTLTKVVKLVVSLTRRDYEDFILRHQRKSEGTYCVPVSENKLLWKHKSYAFWYMRFYRIANSNHIPKVIAYYKDGKKVSKEEWEEAYDKWAKPSAKEKKVSDTYNIKIENIKRLKQGKTVIVFK